MNIDIASLIATIILAFIGYLVTYLNNLKLSQRTERLERINRQLGELYGPLFALTQSSDRAWKAFRENIDLDRHTLEKVNHHQKKTSKYGDYG